MAIRHNRATVFLQCFNYHFTCGGWDRVENSFQVGLTFVGSYLSLFSGQVAKKRAAIRLLQLTDSICAKELLIRSFIFFVLLNRFFVLHVFKWIQISFGVIN